MTEQVPSDSMGTGNLALSGDTVASQGGARPSDTPKTDAVVYYPFDPPSIGVVRAEFARDQERRIAELVDALKVQVGYCACGGSGKRPHSWEPIKVPCQRCSDAHGLITREAQP